MIVREGVKTYAGCGGLTPFIYGFFAREPCSVAGEKIGRRPDTSAEPSYRGNKKGPYKGALSNAYISRSYEHDPCDPHPPLAEHDPAPDTGF